MYSVNLVFGDLILYEIRKDNKVLCIVDSPDEAEAIIKKACYTAKNRRIAHHKAILKA